MIPSVLDGFDLTVLRVNGWLRRAHSHIGVIHTRLVGWLVGTLVSPMVRWTGQCAFAGVTTAVTGQPTYKLETAVLTTYITSVLHLIVNSATVAVIKHILHV